MILCIQCKHCRQDVTYYPSQFGVGRSVRYGNETCALTDTTYGNGAAGLRCAYERTAGTCGPDARYFEPIPPPPEPPEPKPVQRRWWQWWAA